MKTYLNSFLLSLLFFLTTSSLQAQNSIRIEKNPIPWPYDTVSVFTHDRTSAVPDSSLEQVIMYANNSAGALFREYVLTDSMGTDSISKRIIFLDAEDRDTLDFRYLFFNGTPELQWELRKSYQANGEFDSVSTLRYFASSPFRLSSRGVIYYDSLGRSVEFYTYPIRNNAFYLRNYSIREYQDSLLISNSFYRDFNVLSAPILYERTFNFYNSQGSLIYSTLTSRPSPDSSLFLTDSTSYSYDSQNREIRSFTYTSDRVSPLSLSRQDTTIYFSSNIEDYLNTEYLVDGAQLTPDRQLRYIDSDSLFYYRIDIWEDTCQCWWVNFKDSTLYDSFGRRQESFTWSILSPNDTAFYHNQRFEYYADQPIRKYYLDDYNSVNFPRKMSYVYSIGDSILSSRLKPIPLTLKLYPNPSRNLISLEYPSGKTGSVHIL
ncbi:MAG: hypothetical protein AAF696_12885, partial [Bacteroidota bacterium]